LRTHDPGNEHRRGVASLFFARFSPSHMAFSVPEQCPWMF
jgi:hypothetical protein